MEKRTVEMALLLDFYGELLTEKQRTYMEMYYGEDFSLTEIAQLGNITPQGVRDVIRRGGETLLDVEKKTALIRRFSEVSDIAQRIHFRLKAVEDKRPGLSGLFQDIYEELDRLQL